ncbi:MAG: hypothetical protein JO287_03060, partial [Pseudonocardiales bacterium]|nr:hypothetical protein [Pseudonocardiales bacterium]
RVPLRRLAARRSSQNLYAGVGNLHAFFTPPVRISPAMDVVSVLMAIVMFAILLAAVYAIERI